MIQSSKNNSNLQHILFSKEQYQELLRLFSLYALVKQKSPTPLLTTEEFGRYIYSQGGKFGFEKSTVTFPARSEAVPSKSSMEALE